MAATDYVSSRFTVITSPTQNILGTFDIIIKIQPTISLFSCLNTKNGGGVYQEKKPDDYNISIFELEKFLTGKQIDLLLDNPHRPIEFNRDGENNIKIWPFQHNMKFSDGRSSLLGINAPNDNN